MLIRDFLIPEVNETNVYLVACESERRAALIDTGGWRPDAVRWLREQGLELSLICLTHSHYDHTEALYHYAREFPLAERVAGCDRIGEFDCRRPRDDKEFMLSSIRIRALAIPGHTPDCVAYLFEQAASIADSNGPGRPAARVLFCGDVLFAGSVGGAQGAERERELKGIRRKILTLPEDTLVYPGHGPGTTVGIEKRHNPFLQ
jgi:glyoxylase-like metal-dependent hydrolase (beta-lactamase superfamily II)